MHKIYLILHILLILFDYELAPDKDLLYLK